MTDHHVTLDGITATFSAPSEDAPAAAQSPEPLRMRLLSEEQAEARFISEDELPELPTGPAPDFVAIFEAAIASDD
jgi:hypothetical protein